ncbi:TMEM9 [Branchiostoma lanceolatum]|uniref:TMEM9 protein n=1 Tax=Branchiostoma lanceolatum TaxID=7740 RepID=A0A8J9VCI7_BRALA|nr:TMEM9 [Branchiostoma lanceolatum]
MNMYKCTLLVPVFWLLLLTLTTDSVWAEGQYDDRRCKCVCPPRVINNVTRKVYLKNNIARDDCECGKVVDPLPDNPVEFCLRCECEYESRNTMLMKVLVLFVLAVLGVLVVYAGFVMCLEPLCAKPQQPAFPDSGPRHAQDGRPHLVRSASMLGRVDSARQRWKKQVEVQRVNVYDRRNILS